MEFDSVAAILAGERTGQTVRLRGWVHRQRSGGKIAFVTLRDGTGVVQCTVKAGIADAESLEVAKTALIESSVSLLEGEVAKDDRAPGGFEVKVTRFELHQRAKDFPLRGEQGTDFELDNRHLWLRSTQLATVFRIKSRLLHAIRDFYAAQGFVEADPSVITTNACEGGTTLFEFDYFGQTAFLSQSAQMYLEGLIFGNPKVYAITNSFRAEKSRTNKHLTEFHHLEGEYAWWDNEESMRFQERMVTHLAHDIAKHCDADLRLLDQDPERLLRVGSYIESESEADEPGRRFGRMTYHEAAAELRQLGYDFPDGEDFGAPHETALTEGRTNPLFITDWPADIKAFYMHRSDKVGPDGEPLAACADLLGPDGFGELIGGSQRSEDIDWMKQRLRAQLVAEIKGDQPGISEQVAVHHLEDKEAFLELLAADSETAKTLLVEVQARTPGSVRKGLDAAAVHERLHAGDDPGGLWDALMEAVTEPYEWYFDLRRYGSVPHSGFGLGIERLVRWFTGVEHIRDTLPYPRTPSRAYP